MEFESNIDRLTQANARLTGEVMKHQQDKESVMGEKEELQKKVNGLQNIVDKIKSDYEAKIEDINR